MGGAPVFLFLAGVALVLAAGGRMRAGRTEGEVAALARARAWQIFGLALLFRLQSWIISGGDVLRMFKVDILNVMGLSLLATAWLWSAGRGLRSRVILLATAAIVVAMVTPLLRGANSLAFLPDPIEWYFRPPVGSSMFSIFPWAGFVFAGAATGLWLNQARASAHERTVVRTLGLVGLVVAAGAYGMSFLPPIYPQTSFWTSSPAFFFLRLGVVMCLVSLAYWWATGTAQSWLVEMGRSSLFVYWIHVELAYGVVSIPLHRSLPVELALAGAVLLSLFMYALVRAKARFLNSRMTSPPFSNPFELWTAWPRLKRRRS
jgi:uncharacterized membrane protein